MMKMMLFLLRTELITKLLARALGARASSRKKERKAPNELLHLTIPPSQPLELCCKIISQPRCR
jgi:hypothetical protein